MTDASDKLREPAGYCDPQTGFLEMDKLVDNPERACLDCGESLLIYAGDVVDLAVRGRLVYVICARCAAMRRGVASLSAHPEFLERPKGGDGA